MIVLIAMMIALIWLYSSDIAMMIALTWLYSLQWWLHWHDCSHCNDDHTYIIMIVALPWLHLHHCDHCTCIIAMMIALTYLFTFQARLCHRIIGWGSAQSTFWQAQLNYQVCKRLQINFDFRGCWDHKGCCCAGFRLYVICIRIRLLHKLCDCMYASFATCIRCESSVGQEWLAHVFFRGRRKVDVISIRTLQFEVCIPFMWTLVLEGVC
jgi:hypothetical protein